MLRCGGAVVAIRSYVAVLLGCGGEAVAARSYVAVLLGCGGEVAIRNCVAVS